MEKGRTSCSNSCLHDPSIICSFNIQVSKLFLSFPKDMSLVSTVMASPDALGTSTSLATSSIQCLTVLATQSRQCWQSFLLPIKQRLAGPAENSEEPINSLRQFDWVVVLAYVVDSVSNPQIPRFLRCSYVHIYKPGPFKSAKSAAVRITRMVLIPRGG